MPTWQLQEAKARFSELMRGTVTGPQTITVHGRRAAVVLIGGGLRPSQALEALIEGMFSDVTAGRYPAEHRARQAAGVQC